MVSWSRLWIFFALAAILTTATFGYWKWVDRRRRVECKIEDLELRSIDFVQDVV